MKSVCFLIQSLEAPVHQRIIADNAIRRLLTSFTACIHVCPCVCPCIYIVRKRLMCLQSGVAAGGQRSSVTGVSGLQMPGGKPAGVADMAEKNQDNVFS